MKLRLNNLAKTLKRYNKKYTVILNTLIQEKPLYYIWESEELKTEINKIASKREQILSSQLSFIYRNNPQYRIFKSYKKELIFISRGRVQNG